MSTLERRLNRLEEVLLPKPRLADERCSGRGMGGIPATG